MSELLSNLPEELSRGFNEPDWLRQFRAKSVEMYRVLPTEPSQLYIRHHEAPEISEELLLKIPEGLDGGVEIPREFKALTEDKEEPVVVDVDGSPAYVNLPKELERRGVRLLTLHQALKEIPEKMKEIFGSKLVGYESSKYAALVNGLFTTGYVIYIPDGVEVDRVFRVLWVVSKGGKAALGQVMVLAGVNSRLSVIEEYYGPGEEGGEGLLGVVNELYLENGAGVRYAALQNVGENINFIAERCVETGRDSSVTWVGSLIGGKVSKVRVDSRMEGDGSSVNDLEIIFGGGEQRFDLNANLIHRGTGTQGRVLAKGVVKDRARSIFKGIIGIEQQAKNTNAYLAEHAMILSPEARAYAIPGLEILSNDVKATHSASVAQIDNEQLYYLTTRGISEQEARKMITMGFFEPVVSEIDAPEVRWGVRYLLEKKWLPKQEAEKLKPEDIVDLYVEPEEAGKPIEDIFGRHYKYR
ncbi:MAG TPA: Fe-S cluster assembly protein SufD [Aigarchaeota archaeon]|nr:Fe-S cluster assembly protein SufD [Aigarchaeota archaeon]